MRLGLQGFACQAEELSCILRTRWGGGGAGGRERCFQMPGGDKKSLNPERTGWVTGWEWGSGLGQGSRCSLPCGLGSPETGPWTRRMQRGNQQRLDLKGREW